MTEFSQKLHSISGTALDQDDPTNVGWLQAVLKLAAIRIEEYETELQNLRDSNEAETERLCDANAILQRQVNDLRALYDPFLRHFLRITEADYKPEIGSSSNT